MDDALLLHRLHFAFTATFHYVFPQLTMGLAPMIFALKTAALRTRDRRYDDAAAFLAKLFALTFLFGVLTGIPMEFQFGTNWSRFSRFAGGVIGQTLAMEGTFAFFLESAFVGLLVFGEKRIGRVAHWAVSGLVFLGTWLSGYFIVATDAWMQHPVGYETAADGSVRLASFSALLFNRWALVQYFHTMSGAAVTGAFFVAALGAFYALAGRHAETAKVYLRFGVAAACVMSVVQAFPTGDASGKMVAAYQPAALAAMEGLYSTETGAGLVMIGQPNSETRTLDNPVRVPGALSFLTFSRWDAEVKGLDAFPRDQWPDNVPLLYYSYHIMVGLGTLFIAVSLAAAALLRRGRLFSAKPMLWVLTLALPFPFIANTAGWMTTELGRQPWLVYGLMRTDAGFSATVSGGTALFSLLGFLGIYMVMGILYLFLMWERVAAGPSVARPSLAPEAARAPEHELEPAGAL